MIDASSAPSRSLTRAWLGPLVLAMLGGATGSACVRNASSAGGDLVQAEPSSHPTGAAESGDNADVDSGAEAKRVAVADDGATVAGDTDGDAQDRVASGGPQGETSSPQEQGAGSESAGHDPAAASATAVSDDDPSRKDGRKVLASRVFPGEDRNPACGNGKGVGQNLPGFDLPSTSGKNVSSRAVRGQVTLVNFWATWCKPCLSELPKFNKIARRYRKNGLRFLAISTDEDGAEVQALLKEKSLSMQALYAGEATAKQFGERPLPFSLVVDHRGKVIAVYDGFREECLSSLETDLRDALSAKAER